MEVESQCTGQRETGGLVGYSHMVALVLAMEQQGLSTLR